jgi:hypothetical protein
MAQKTPRASVPRALSGVLARFPARFNVVGRYSAKVPSQAPEAIELPLPAANLSIFSIL